MPSSGRRGCHRAHARTHVHTGKPRHRAHHRRQRRRKRLQGIVFAASTFLSPHALKPAKTKVTTAATYRAVPPKARITTSATYRAIPANVMPDVVSLQSDPEQFEPFVQEAAEMHGLDPALIRAVMRFESAFRPTVVSPSGAAGLMQLMPDVAAELGVKDIFDPRENILAGARYLRELLDRHNGAIDLALASYNAGPAAVDRYHAVPPFPETRRYVENITSFLRKARTETGKP
jgi:soluble lytic murein transglycosylase-like protein